MQTLATLIDGLDALDPTRYHILDYRDIASAPKATMTAVYAALGVEMTPAYAQVLDALQEKARSHVSGHDYGLEEFGLSEDAIRADAPTVFQRYRFD